MAAQEGRPSRDKVAELEHELQVAQAQVDQFVRHSPAVIYVLKINGEQLKPTMVTDNIERFLGVKSAEATFEWWYSNVHPEDIERASAATMSAQTTGGYSIEYRIRHSDGTYRWIEDNNRVIRDSNGQPVEMIGVWTDITARVNAEAELQRAHDDLEDRVKERTAELQSANEVLVLAKEVADSANMAKSRFLSRMSHELRTPLNAILGFGQLLEDSELSSQQLQDLGLILKSGHHLLGLIDDVLEISRIETGTLGVSVEPVSSLEVINECIELMSNLAKSSSVSVDVIGLDDFTVSADRRHLRQVLLNLLSNAIKFNVKGGSVRVTTRFADDGRLVIEVADTGIGVSESGLKKLFTPFERLGAEARNIEGTGLGLALSKTLIESMGGTIDAASKLGTGTTMRISLRSADSLPALKSDAGGRGELRSVGPVTILLIEDNSLNTMLVQQAFADKPGVRLLTAQSGRDGLDTARTTIPDVVLLDLHLPDISGRQVMIEMRKDPSLRGIPVIVVTADAFAARELRHADSGVFECLTKPIELTEFFDCVSRATEHRSNAA